MLLQKETLWQRLIATTENARRCGALLPVPTESVFIEERGVRFFVRVLASLRRKDEARRKQDAAAREGRNVNPFLPPEKELTVAGISGTHVAVLNKFNVVDRHLLIVTRRFEDQDSLLTLDDFEALWRCMAEYDSLGFYNGGREAGASQRHKHLQLVPLPLSPEGPAVPVAPLLAEAPPQQGVAVSVPAFAFLHAFVRYGDILAAGPLAAAQRTFELYRSMLSGLGLAAPPASGQAMQSSPYCLLVTRDWMLLVPRSKEFFGEVSLNSLAFAGSFFVRDRGQLERLQSSGLLNALRAVAVERGPGR